MPEFSPHKARLLSHTVLSRRRGAVHSFNRVDRVPARHTVYIVLCIFLHESLFPEDGLRGAAELEMCFLFSGIFHGGVGWWWGVNTLKAVQWLTVLSREVWRQPFKINQISTLHLADTALSIHLLYYNVSLIFTAICCTARWQTFRYSALVTM